MQKFVNYLLLLIGVGILIWGLVDYFRDGEFKAPTFAAALIMILAGWRLTTKV